MTDWGQWLSCKQCSAVKGRACFALSSGGPDALPAEMLDVPHSGRKMSGVKAVPVGRLPSGPKRANPARRAARRTEVAATGWAAVAEQQQRRREAR